MCVLSDLVFMTIYIYFLDKLLLFNEYRDLVKVSRAALTAKFEPF